jgi:hypothetical protein
VARLILDTGAVLAFIRGDARAAAAVRVAWQRGDDVVVPAIVVAQVIRGGPRDVPVHRLLRTVHVPFVGVRLARRAGELLGAPGMADAADALVMAEALWSVPSVLLTSDPNDMQLLLGDSRLVRIVPI